MPAITKFEPTPLAFRAVRMSDGRELARLEFKDTCLRLPAREFNRPDPLYPPAGGLVLSFAGIVLALVTGWLGAELVERLGVGVDEGVGDDVNQSRGAAGRGRAGGFVGNPVGSAGAAESKDALWAEQPAPCCIVAGRLGGSAITVAAINALGSRLE